MSERKESNNVKTAEGYVNDIGSEYREKDLESSFVKFRLARLNYALKSILVRRYALCARQ